MPTHEERLTTVEENLREFKAFQTETINRYQDMAMHLTMLKGLTETSVGKLALIQAQSDQMGQRLAAVEITQREHTDLFHDHTERFNRLEIASSQQTGLLNEQTQQLTRLEEAFKEQTTLMKAILSHLPQEP